jgi:hypothetical protein
MNNLIANKIKQIITDDSKGVDKLACTSCNKFYIGRTNSKFNTRFKENRKYFIYAEG